MHVAVQINGRRLEMELHTGAAVSVISEDTFNALQLQATVDINTSDMILCTYLGKPVKYWCLTRIPN